MPRKGQRKLKHIYALVDPRDCRIRYVGQTNWLEERMRCHSSYYSAQKREAHKAKGRWLQALLAQNLKPSMVLLETVPWAEGDAAEKRWIQYGSRLGWDLFNVPHNPAQLTLLVDERMNDHVGV